MRFLTKVKDGGPKSPVDAYILFEIKSLCSIMFLKFNKGGRVAFHTHAFHALTWFLFGEMEEFGLGDGSYTYKRSVIPKVTPYDLLHKVWAYTDSWCFTIRGPWQDHWYEWENDKLTKLTHGRVKVK